MNLLNILLQAAATDPNASPWAKYNGFIMIIAIVAIFYFLMIRPQQKRQKDIQKAREAMKTGDKVVTAGGIHGIIKEIADTTILMDIDKGVSIRIDKSSVFASSEDIQPK
ncbi:MAG: preprotein translocase subunit YajC [Tannerella sp.]|jgi:preprotein translocase subunit YajC|nr:preprotein translocase subunit YajC [Tannerella sp.]